MYRLPQVVGYIFTGQDSGNPAEKSSWEVKHLHREFSNHTELWGELEIQVSSKQRGFGKYTGLSVKAIEGPQWKSKNAP